MHFRPDRSGALAAVLLLHILAIALALLESRPGRPVGLPEPRLVIWIISPSVAPGPKAAPLSASPAPAVVESTAPVADAATETPPTEQLAPQPPQEGDISGREAKVGGGHGDPFAGAAPVTNLNTAAMRIEPPTRPPGPPDDPIALAQLNAEAAGIIGTAGVSALLEIDREGVVKSVRLIEGGLKPGPWRALQKLLVGRRLYPASDISAPVWRLVSLAGAPS